MGVLFCLPQALGFRTWELTRVVVPLMIMRMRGIYLNGKTTRFCQVKWSVQKAMVSRDVDIEYLDPRKPLMIGNMILWNLTPRGKV